MSFYFFMDYTFEIVPNLVKFADGTSTEFYSINPLINLVKDRSTNYAAVGNFPIAANINYYEQMKIKRMPSSSSRNLSTDDFVKTDTDHYKALFILSQIGGLYVILHGA